MKPLGLTHSLTHSLIARLCKVCLFALLFTLTLGLAHCSSDDNGGGGGGGETTDPPTDKGQYTCANGTPSEGSPDGADDVESCLSCDTGWLLRNERCGCKLVLDASMTVGVSDRVFGFGIVSGGVFNAGGMLSEVALELNGAAYTISGLLALDADASGSPEDLYLAFAEGELPSGARAGLVLQLDSREFAFSSGAVSFSSGAGAYFWNDVSPVFSWSASDMVSVKLCVK